MQRMSHYVLRGAEGLSEGIELKPGVIRLNSSGDAKFTEGCAWGQKGLGSFVQQPENGVTSKIPKIGICAGRS